MKGALAGDTARRMPATTDGPPAFFLERIKRLRFLPFDSYPRVVEWAQRPLGRVVLVGLFAVFLALQRPLIALPITLMAAACAFAGPYRRQVLTLATLVLVFANLNWFGWFGPDGSV